jgi:hypothetical protein
MISKMSVSTTAAPFFSRNHYVAQPRYFQLVIISSRQTVTLLRKPFKNLPCTFYWNAALV